MKTLLITIFVAVYVITVVESSLRLSRPNKRSSLLDERTSYDSRPRWQATGLKGSLINTQRDKYSSKTKQMRKSDHYIDPKILKQLSGVKDIKDFVKKLNPKGFTIKKEKVLKKVPTAPGKKPIVPVIGIPGVSVVSPDSSISGTQLGSSKPDYVYQEVEEETVYYEGQKVADPLQSSSSSEDACIPRNITQSLERIGVVSYPSCVILKKCGGCCRSAKECVAASTVNKTITVIEISGTGYQIVSKTFTDDATCECDCIVKATDCLPTQTYSKDRCQCECKLPEQSCPTGKHWSKAECNCMCSNRQDCSSQVRKWDESSCSCVCIDTPCPTGQSRNPENCLCT